MTHRGRAPRRLVCLCLFAVAAQSAGSEEMAAGVRVVKTPPTQSKNKHYVSNRPPLTPSPLIKLPIGAITPKGWLRHMLELEATGMTGHLEEISHWCRFKGSAWASADGKGRDGWEELPYWLKGYGDLGYVLKDEKIIKNGRKWIEAMLSSGESDGWFGPRANKKGSRRRRGKPDVWPNMVAMNCLQSYHEYSGDERVLKLMSGYFRWQLTVADEDFLVPFWQHMRAGDNLESVYWLYNRTGEEALLKVGEKVHRNTANWTKGIASWHGVNISQCFRQPGVYYMQSHDRSKHLAAVERNYRTVMGLYGQVPGGMFGADENCRPGYYGPRQAAETCSMVEFMHSFEMMLKITGDPRWADRCEEVALNSLPASQPPDLKGLHYLTAPNMVQLDSKNKSPGLQNGGQMLSYNPHAYRCCQHNVSHGWPYYAEELWLATPDNGLCASLYAASSVEAKVADGTTVKIEERTDYPFADTVRLTLSCAKDVQFPLYLRVPRWCEGAKVAVNTKAVDVAAKPLTYVAIDRTWADGDTVDLTLPMEVSLRVWKKNHNAVSVDRGPLTYSLRIGEKWVRYAGTDKWPAYEVYPTTPWNYGLVLDGKNPTASLTFVPRPDSEPLPRQPFTVEAAPVRIVAEARKIPQWKLDRLNLVGKLQASPARTDEPVEEVTLIPMGCARLRISAFPTASTGADAHEWTAPKRPDFKITASHCWRSDTVTACADGLLPRSSNDHAIPRHTWWDHKGTAEWIAYEFDKPKTISQVEIYWFDDTGRGQCRVPKSWRLMVREGKEWKPAEAEGDYAVEKDRLNKVRIKPVTTRGLRLEVQLQEGVSGGVLEWRFTERKG